MIIYFLLTSFCCDLSPFLFCRGTQSDISPQAWVMLGRRSALMEHFHSFLRSFVSIPFRAEAETHPHCAMLLHRPSGWGRWPSMSVRSVWYSAVARSGRKSLQSAGKQLSAASPPLKPVGPSQSLCVLPHYLASLDASDITQHLENADYPLCSCRSSRTGASLCLCTLKLPHSSRRSYSN